MDILATTVAAARSAVGDGLGVTLGFEDTVGADEGVVASTGGGVLVTVSAVSAQPTRAVVSRAALNQCLTMPGNLVRRTESLPKTYAGACSLRTVMNARIQPG